MDAGGVPVIAELRSRMATIAGNGDGAESGAVPDSKEPQSPEGPKTPARASPPVSAAALMVADELLRARGVSPGAGAHTEGTDAGPSSVRLVVGGQCVEVSARGVVLGRQPGSAGVVVSDARVSRRHALVRRTDAGIAVSDLGSMNGTVIVRSDGRTVAVAGESRAGRGDHIMTANGLLLAEVAGEESPGGQ